MYIQDYIKFLEISEEHKKNRETAILEEEKQARDSLTDTPIVDNHACNW